MSHQPDNIFAGTQVVVLIEVRGPGNSLVHPRGAVGVVTRTPAVEGEQYLVRFPDGFESAFPPEQLEVLKHFKDRLGVAADVSRLTSPPHWESERTHVRCYLRPRTIPRRRSMTFDLAKILQSKREFRQRLAARPIVEKLALLDALRERALAIRPAQPMPEAGMLREEPPGYRAQPKPTK